MPDDLYILLGVLAAAVLLVVIVRRQQQAHRGHVVDTARQEVCPHLRPALEKLLERGHEVRRVGQRNPEAPLEIHIGPGFDVQELHDALELAEPVFVSERNVLYCKEDWCEIHPPR